MNPNVSHVENTTRSLSIQPPCCLQPSTPDAVAPYSTRHGKPSSENSETILILMAILQGVTEYTTSGDVLALAVFRAQAVCSGMGISEDTFTEVVRRYGEFAKVARKGNPFAF